MMQTIWIAMLVGGAALMAGCDSREAGEGAEPPPSQSHESVEKIDLNSATLAELEVLPGIGDVMAQRIIEGRPYESVEDVLRVNGVGEGTLQKIRDLVVAK